MPLSGYTCIIAICLCYLTGPLTHAQITTVHEDVTRVVIKSEGKADYFRKRKWTLHSEAEKENGHVFIPYSPFIKIKSLSLNIYNARGERLEKIRKNDFIDHSASRGFEVGDDRILFYMYDSPTYPVTFELEYEQRLEGLLFLPEWRPVGDFNISLERGSFTVICPTDNLVNYKTYNLSAPRQTDDGGVTTLAWEVNEKVEPISREPCSPHIRHYTPYVKLAPQNFEMEKYSGDFKSWQGLGRWCENLLIDRDELPEETVRYLQTQFGAISDPALRAQRVYEWMQGKTRYVSIQLGIGGWQPMPASEVDEFGYGDCKALTNYTMAALKAVRIESHYSLVYSGNAEQVDPEFPAQSFNHVILSVPLDGDTVWLECTSQKIPFGQMGPQTIGKYSLIINGDQTALARVKSIDGGDQIHLSNTVEVVNTGSTSEIFKAQTTYSEFAYVMGVELSEYSQKDLKDYFNDALGRPSLKLSEIQATANDRLKKATISSTFTLSSFSKMVGDQLILNPSIFQSGFPELPYDQNREKDVIFHYSFLHNDSIYIMIPQGLTVNFLPPNKKLKSEFGSYDLNYIVEGQTLMIIGRRELNKGRIPRENYENLRAFLIECNKLMGTGIVFSKPAVTDHPKGLDTSGG